MSKSQKAADCQSCPTVFEYEERDIFAGEIFCPRCMSRVPCNHRYSTLNKAQKVAPQSKVYSD